MNNSNITIRTAQTHDDFQLLLSLIEKLAQFEDLAGPDNDAKVRFIRHGLEENPPRFVGLLAYLESNPEPCGYAILFDNYSTFLCKPGLYLEDIFVLPDFRKNGVGKAFFDYLVDYAKDHDYGRIEWTCLDWNTKAQDFYSKIGAHHHKEWMHFRMDEDAIHNYQANRDDLTIK